jgi:hypothetical protein
MTSHSYRWGTEPEGLGVSFVLQDLKRFQKSNYFGKHCIKRTVLIVPKNGVIIKENETKLD